MSCAAKGHIQQVVKQVIPNQDMANIRRGGRSGCPTVLPSFEQNESKTCSLYDHKWRPKEWSEISTCLER